MNIVKVGISGILWHNQKILLGKRSSTDTQPGMWVTPGGGIEYTEALNQALRREFWEEVSLEVDVSDKFTTACDRIHEKGHIVMIFKQVTLISGTPAPSSELVEVKWFSMGEIMDAFARNEITIMTFRAIRAFEAYLFRSGSKH